MRKENLDQLAKAHHAHRDSDQYLFQRLARLKQSMWRESMGYPAATIDGEILGSRLPTDFAIESMANYLTPGIRNLVNSEIDGASEGQVFGKPRIYDNLLSSQPLAFNLFGELKLDLELATRVFGRLRPDTIESVQTVLFEYSPGRGDDRFTGDRSAFDVFVEYVRSDGRQGFLGIEVKYHESMSEKAAKLRERYEQVADSMGCFKSDKREALRKSPLQQVWRDHLLAGACLEQLDYDEGTFILLYPAANERCLKVAAMYKDALSDTATFETWTLEDVVATVRMCTDADWIREFEGRYL